MIRVGIVGATGYTAYELLTLLARHPNVDVVALTSRDPDLPPVEQVHPELRLVYDLSFETLDVESFCRRVDVAFCCLPHAASAEIVSQLLEHSVKVVDFSADYRLNDVATFEAWYGVEHPDPVRVGKVVYGMPEFFRDQIREADLVANPGCFPTSVLLPLIPLVQDGLVETDRIIVDSKTGVSGAGRKPNLKFHYPECNDSIVAYGIGTHRHRPEMEQLIERATGAHVGVTFTPHLVPMNRGILSTIYLQPKPDVDAKRLNRVLHDYYENEPFVRVVDQPPATRHVAGSNFCDVMAVDSGQGIVVLSALDNLVKGASGAAVQNMNLMMGLPEVLGLLSKRLGCRVDQ